jgi:hypothetical protein
MNLTGILKHWNFVRILQLVFGIYIGIQAVITLDFLSTVVSIFFLYQAYANTGCCGVSSCPTPINTNSNTLEQVEYEQVK